MGRAKIVGYIAGAAVYRSSGISEVHSERKWNELARVIKESQRCVPPLHPSPTIPDQSRANYGTFAPAVLGMRGLTEVLALRATPHSTRKRRETIQARTQREHWEKQKAIALRRKGRGGKAANPDIMVEEEDDEEEDGSEAARGGAAAGAGAPGNAHSLTTALGQDGSGDEGAADEGAASPGAVADEEGLWGRHAFLPARYAVRIPLQKTLARSLARLAYIYGVV